VSGLIKFNAGGRTLEVLDLDLIFPAGLLNDAAAGTDAALSAAPQRARTYSRFVVFESEGQRYGVQVEETQEITFLSEIDDMFQRDAIEGALNLRGSTIPVLNAARLLRQSEASVQASEDTRILVLTSKGIHPAAAGRGASGS
jgi:purine-binding chemotaxis protein CheW